jgi:sulfide:quinone oxidoreductase
MAAVSRDATVCGMTSSLPTRVVIAGGGIGGLEAMFALRSLAGYRVLLTLMTPDPVFRIRALSVGDPFSGPALRRYDVGRLCSEVDAEFVQDAVASVDPGARTVTTGGGETVPYDDLVLAMGALQRAPYAGGITFRGLEDAEAVHGLIQDVELGAVESVVFVVPSGTTWPLPLYELALLTAERAFAMGVDVGLTLVTPEERPLGYFGLDASATVTGLLRDAGIELLTETHVRDLDHGTAVGIDGTPVVQARRAVTIPVLEGRRIPGVPTDARGFVPVDEHGAVIGLPGVWAVGDATTFPLKQGGLAAQQADAAAAAIAAGAGASVALTTHHPIMRAKLFTGGRPAHLGEVTSDDDAKVATTYLAPMLTRLGTRAPA